MQILKFNLSGKTAFFKQPDVNKCKYYTYSQIHKVALLGVLGSILGLDGYKEQEEANTFPEFYDKLKDIKVSIEPKYKDNRISFLKSFQSFNNSVGYASREDGCNLIVTEQWLLDVSWDIYIVVDSDITKTLKEMLEKKNSYYNPYLGKNDHLAEITDVEIIDKVEWLNIKEVKNIDSLFAKEDVEIDIEAEKNIDIDSKYKDTAFTYKEYLPYALDNYLSYKKKVFINTNRIVKVINKDTKIAEINSKKLYFY